MGTPTETISLSYDSNKGEWVTSSASTFTESEIFLLLEGLNAVAFSTSYSDGLARSARRKLAMLLEHPDTVFD